MNLSSPVSALYSAVSRPSSTMFPGRVSLQKKRNLTDAFEALMTFFVIMGGRIRKMIRSYHNSLEK